MTSRFSSGNDNAALAGAGCGCLLIGGVLAAWWGFWGWVVVQLVHILAKAVG